MENLFGKLEQPVVVVVEDLHWAGDASLTLLAQLEQILRHLPILLVGTYREEERADLPQQLSSATLLRLGRFEASSIAELAESMLGPAGREPHIHELLRRETEGNAFFLVEVVRALAEDAGRLEDIDANDLPRHISTGGIDRIIQRRLNRVPEKDRALLRLAAVLGREVDPKLLSWLEEGLDLDRWLKSCADAAVLEVYGGQWRLVHNRLRQRLVGDMPAANLRRAHRRSAEAIFAVYGDGADRIDALAHHWSEAADVGDQEATGKATTYLQRAGRAAMATCANRQATRYLSQGLKLLGTLPSTPEYRHREIRIQVDLGGTYLMSKGFTASEVGQAFGRARSLCEETSETEELMPALLGLWRFHIVRGELDTSQRLAEEMIAHAKAQRSTPHLVLARYALGTTFLFQGLPEPSSSQFDDCLKLYEDQHDESQQRLAAAAFFLGQNPGVAAYDYSGWAQWCLGNPDTASQCNRRGLALAEKLGHPFSLAFAHTLVAWLDVLKNDDRAADRSAGESIALCREQGFPYFLAVSSIFHGWARARRGETREGIAQITKVLEGLRAAGSELFRPFFLALLAEVFGLAELPDEGLEAIDEALEDVDGRGGGWWEPEIFRVRGELNLMKSDPELAENAFLKALHRARWRKERALELRAVMSLVRLWRGRDDEQRYAKARRTLEKLYATYTEGFDTPDLVEAKNLLQISE